MSVLAKLFGLPAGPVHPRRPQRPPAGREASPGQLGANPGGPRRRRVLQCYPVEFWPEQLNYRNAKRLEEFGGLLVGAAIAQWPAETGENLLLNDSVLRG